MPRPARALAPHSAARLREAAADAFASSGLEGASLNGILRRAQMGKGSFYHRFADKAALHDWVASGLASDLLDEVRPPTLSALTTATFRPELDGMLDRASRVAATRPELTNLGRMFHNSAEAPAERAIAAVRSGVMDFVTGALETGQSLGVVRRDLPIDLLTTWTIASLMAIDEWTLTATTEVALRRAAADRALDTLWQLVSVAGAPERRLALASGDAP